MGGCKDTLLGTFKLNQSFISNVTVAVQTAMRSGAQVDINFNHFLQNLVAVVIINSSQSTTVTANTFDIDEAAPVIDYAAGIVLSVTKADAPPNTRLVIHNNKFNLSDSADLPLDAISVAVFDGPYQTVSLAVTNNTFNLFGENIAGVWGVDIDNGAVSANLFNGFGWSAVTVLAENLLTISDWTITANKGLLNFTANKADIEIGYDVLQTIVGPQNATVSDLGTGSSLLSVEPGDSNTMQTDLGNKTEKSFADRQRAVAGSHAKLMQFLKRN